MWQEEFRNWCNEFDRYRKEFNNWLCVKVSCTSLTLPVLLWLLMIQCIPSTCRTNIMHRLILKHIFSKHMLSIQPPYGIDPGIKHVLIVSKKYHVVVKHLCFNFFYWIITKLWPVLPDEIHCIWIVHNVSIHSILPDFVYNNHFSFFSFAARVFLKQ